jgi:hypothetical protein
MTSGKIEDPGSWKRKHWIAIAGELALENATDRSRERLWCERTFSKQMLSDSINRMHINFQVRTTLLHFLIET